MEWIKCISGQMSKDDERYKGKKVINVIATTNKGVLRKYKGFLIIIIIIGIG